MSRRWRLALAGAVLLPTAAAAHGFGQLYTLPVPLWLYGWAAAATLIVSFLVAGLFLSSTPKPGEPGALELGGLQRLRTLLPLLRGLAVFILLLCIVTGFFGHRDPLRNFSLTFFWVIFVLLFTYLTALLGDFYAALNPWRTLADAIDRAWRGFARGRVTYPAWLADWPALLLYMGFIGFELFGSGRGHSLAVALSAYTLLNLVGVWYVGARAWFRHGELFSVFFRLVALMAPLAYRRGKGSGRGRLMLCRRARRACRFRSRAPRSSWTASTMRGGLAVPRSRRGRNSWRMR